MSARSRPIGSIVRSQVYVRDDGPFEAPHPPTALFRCRSGDRPIELLFTCRPLLATQRESSILPFILGNGRGLPPSCGRACSATIKMRSRSDNQDEKADVARLAQSGYALPPQARNWPAASSSGC